MIKRQHSSKKLSGFSLVELIVSMGIVGVILVMLNTVIINTAIAAQKSLARGFIREELSTVTDLVAADIRSADRIGTCTGTLLTNDLFCEIYGLENVTWQNCVVDNVVRLCRISDAGVKLYNTSATLTLSDASFQVGFGTGTLATRRNIIFTVVGGHRNEAMEVTNIVRQTVISTRNYVLI